MYRNRALTVTAFALISILSSTSQSMAATAKATPKPTVKTSAKSTIPTGMKSPGAAGNGSMNRGGGVFQNLTETQKACLTKNGFTPPDRANFAGGPNPGASGRPSFNPSGRPSINPSARPSNFPSGGANGFRGGSGFDPTVMQKAFKACGIQFQGFGGGNQSPVPASTSKATPKASATVSAKQSTFEKCMTSAGIKKPAAALAYDQSDPDTALAAVKCQKSSGFTLPKKK